MTNIIRTVGLLSQLLADIIPVGAELVDKIGEAALDGKISREEAEDIGAEALREPDIRAKIRGIDVLDERAEEQIGRFLGGVIFNITQALGAPRKNKRK